MSEAIVLRNRGHRGCDPEATLTAWTTASGTVVLACDECGAGFEHPDRAWAVDGPDFSFESDERFHDSCFATPEDVESTGWPIRWFFLPGEPR